MGLFSKKQKDEEPSVREPVRELDRSYYVQTTPAAKKTADIETTKVKKTATTEKKPAEKKAAAKPAAEKKTAAKPAAKKEAAPKAATAKKPAAAKPAAEKKTAAKPAAEKKPVAKSAAAKGEAKTYLISKNVEKNKWQVKAYGAERVLKYFVTKKEAEEYVKGLMANNENAKVHKKKVDGKYQKK